VKVSPVPKARWSSICKDCAGAIDSLVELLQGRFSKGVMERICRQRTGLFPSPDEIKLSCSCPDWASMCKHVAAALYGIGARLDEQPELLFKLREVDEKELIARAGKSVPLARKGPAAEKVLDGGDLSAIFGLELAQGVEAEARTARKKEGQDRSCHKQPTDPPRDKWSEEPGKSPGEEEARREAMMSRSGGTSPIARRRSRQTSPPPRIAVNGRFLDHGAPALLRRNLANQPKHFRVAQRLMA